MVLLSSHQTLNIPDTQCRICGLNLSRKNNAKRHEINTHQVSFMNGQAYQPSTSSQSCPPTQRSRSRSTVRPNVTASSASSSLVTNPQIPTPNSPGNASPFPSATPVNLQCKSCLKQFQRVHGLLQHQCKYAYDEQQLQSNGITPCILRPPKNPVETLKLLEDLLCTSDIISFAKKQNWAVPGNVLKYIL